MIDLREREKNGLGQKKRTEEEERQKRNRLYVEGKKGKEEMNKSLQKLILFK